MELIPLCHVAGAIGASHKRRSPRHPDQSSSATSRSGRGTGISGRLISSDEVKLPDGEIWRSERSKWSLKKEAFPKIFSNCRSYLSDTKSKRRSPRNRERNDGDIKLTTKRRKVFQVIYYSFDLMISITFHFTFMFCYNIQLLVNRIGIVNDAENTSPSVSDIAQDVHDFNFEILLLNFEEVGKVTRRLV